MIITVHITHLNYYYFSLYERIFNANFYSFISLTIRHLCDTLLQSKMIGDAAYKSIWYNLKPNESKLILLIMLRSQRRLTVTAGKIMDLSLEAFTSVRFLYEFVHRVNFKILFTSINYSEEKL